MQLALETVPHSASDFVSRANPIAICEGDTFTTKSHGRLNIFRREIDDPAPMFESVRIRLTHLTCSDDPRMEPYTFGTEPEWFIQRGLFASSRDARLPSSREQGKPGDRVGEVARAESIARMVGGAT